MRGSENIRLATIKIRSGRAGGLEATLRVPRQGNIDVGVLQEKNRRTVFMHVRERGTLSGQQRRRAGTGEEYK